MKKNLSIIIDVDGVATPGTFTYSKNGKIYKNFGADDHDALEILERLRQRNYFYHRR